jgi:hypothetical protein
LSAVVFTYLDAFDEDRTGVEALKAHYRGGGLGDMAAKRRLADILQTLLAPIRDRRAILARDPGHILTVLRRGTLNARRVTQATLDEVRNALGLSGAVMEVTKWLKPLVSVSRIGDSADAFTHGTSCPGELGT